MTTTEREQLIEAIWYQMPSITLHDRNTDNETIVVEVETLKDFIRNFQFEPTEGSTEDAREPDRACQPNWEEMYKEEAAKNEDLRMRFEDQRSRLERAWASLRTFEFVFGRRLNGIC